jgi:hypothetical protein
MNRVILVGNDISTRDHELGSLIDSHDTVVRFGWYDKSPERKKHIGSKTDVWATAQYDPIRAKEKYHYIFQHGFCHAAKHDPVYKRITEMQEKQFGKEACPTYRPFGRVWMDMDNYINLAKGRPRKMYEEPSEFLKYSSALTFAWILSHKGDENGNLGNYRGEANDSEIPLVEQISVYGFDWWGMSKNSSTSMDGVSVGKRWHGPLELDFFGSLWLDGKIRDLNPDSDFYHEPRK